jgi:hypothetical protein
LNVAVAAKYFINVEDVIATIGIAVKNARKLV